MNRLRQIKRLTIRAPDRAAVWHGRRLLEDSFRTASLANDSSSRLIILRRLDIGQIKAGVPPNTVARQIEKQIQLSMNTAVYALTPEAERATAVFFHDEAEPFTTLIQQLLSGKKPAAWFWPLCIPHYQPQAAQASAIVAIIQAAAQKQDRYPVIFPIWQEVAKAETATALTFIKTLVQMKPEDLWRTLGHSRPSPVALQINRQQPVTPALLLAEDQIILQKWLAEPAAANQGNHMHQSQFLTWLLTLMLARATKRFDVNTKLITEAASIAAQIQTPQPAVRAPQTTAKREEPARYQDQNLLGAIESRLDKDTAVADGRITTEHLPTELQSQRLPDSATAVAGIDLEPTDEATGFLSGQVRHGEAETAVIDEIEETAFALPDLAETNGGGLFFVIPILNRLGFLDFLEDWPSLPASDFPIQLLHFLSQQVEVAENDPVRLSLPHPADTSTPLIRWKIPQSWQQFMDPDELLPALPQNQEKPQPVSTAVLLQIWHHALAQWCFHFTKMSLSELIVRPARVTASKTHIDVIFNINDIDIRVRRAGLDQNPGWVPWLARVVYFHFKDLNIAGAKDDS